MQATDVSLDSAALSYFECVRVLECVKSVEGEAQTLFGQYTAPRVKVSNVSIKKDYNFLFSWKYVP